MKKRYTTAEKFETLSDIEARPKVGNVHFDLDAQEAIIGEDWIVCVAARPIPGTVTWTDADTFPMFWSATDPESDFGPGYLKRCEELDASEMVFVTEDHIRATVQAYYDEEWAGKAVDVSKYELEDLWNSFLRIMEEVQ